MVENNYKGNQEILGKSEQLTEEEKRILVYDSMIATRPIIEMHNEMERRALESRKRL